MPREIPRETTGNTAGNTAGAGIKFPTIPHDGNLIGENPAVVVGRIVSRPAGDKTRIATLRYGPITLESRLSSQFLTGHFCICPLATFLELHMGRHTEIFGWAKSLPPPLPFLPLYLFYQVTGETQHVCSHFTSHPQLVAGAHKFDVEQLTSKLNAAAEN